MIFHCSLTDQTKPTFFFCFAVVKGLIDPVNTIEVRVPKDVTKGATDARLLRRNAIVTVMTGPYLGEDTAGGPIRRIRSVSFPQKTFCSSTLWW